MTTLVMLLQKLGLESQLTPLIALLLPVGLCLLLAGYRLVRCFVFLAGFCLGVAVSTLFLDTVVSLGVGLIVGMLFLAAWYLGVFAVGMAMGVIICLLTGVCDELVLCVAAVVGGFVALVLRKLVIVLSTSFTGAYLCVGAVAGLFKWTHPVAQLASTLALAIVGVACQYSRKSSAASTKDEVAAEG